MQNLNVLSLFDGLSGAMCALHKLGVVPKNYFANEIDEYDIKISKKNFPNIIQLGDVTKWENWNLPQIDLLIGGSPCQDLSVAGNKAGLQCERSSLFWTYIDILDAFKPRYFVLENVRPAKAVDQTLMTNACGVFPKELDAAKVSAQRRKRLFWTNIPNIKQPKIIPSKIYPHNKIGLVIADILEENAIRKPVNIRCGNKECECVVTGMCKKRIIETSYGVRWNANKQGVQRQNERFASEKGTTIDAHCYKSGIPIVKENGQPQGQCAQIESVKSFTLCAGSTAREMMFFLSNTPSQGNRAVNINKKHGTLLNSRLETKTNIIRFEKDYVIERLTWTEIERLAGLPDGYSDLGVENRKEARGRSIGNGFQIDIVAHLLSFMNGFPEPIPRSHSNILGEQITLF